MLLGWLGYSPRVARDTPWLNVCVLFSCVAQCVVVAGVAGADTLGEGSRALRSVPWPLPLASFPLRACNWTPPGSGTRQGRPRWLQKLPPYVHSREDVQAYVEEWDVIQGFIAPESVFYMHLVTAIQHEVGVLGAVGEIGVATGLSIMGMALARRGNESLVAVDLFDIQAGKEERNGGDDLDGQRMRIFEENLMTIGIDATRDMKVYQGSSLELVDIDFVQLSGGRGFRMFQVDGAHFAHAAYQDLCSVACSLMRGGVLLLDDVFSTGWLGVGEAFHRFMHTQGWLRERTDLTLVPFLYVGRLYMAEASYAELYRLMLRASLPASDGLGAFISKWLYDHEILCPKDFDLKLLGSAKRRVAELIARKKLDVTEWSTQKISNRFSWGEAMLALRPY